MDGSVGAVRPLSSPSSDLLSQNPAKPGPNSAQLPKRSLASREGAAIISLALEPRSGARAWITENSSIPKHLSCQIAMICTHWISDSITVTYVLLTFPVMPFFSLRIPKNWIRLMGNLEFTELLNFGGGEKAAGEKRAPEGARQSRDNMVLT